jgi:hypothetical protein
LPLIHNRCKRKRKDGKRIGFIAANAPDVPEPHEGLLDGGFLPIEKTNMVAKLVERRQRSRMGRPVRSKKVEEHLPLYWPGFALYSLRRDQGSSVGCTGKGGGLKTFLFTHVSWRKDLV